MHCGEVYDAEIYGAIEALRAAVIARQEGQNIFVLLDNQAAVGALQTGKTTSLLKLTRTFREIARMANDEVR
ncbi:putative te1b-like protein [Erysiphe necator]|uniref:Putative te1b-like protein n=1 Tax=Uncinula necator TaxID=52586 RepID=A0A0B1P4E9_UNCNE|nr:putative te1b-like protein [Erysiphe necator]